MEYVEVQLAKILSRVEKYQLSLRGVIDDALRNRIMDKSLIPVILAMGLGVLRNYKLLDFISMQALGIKPSILSTLKKWLLRIIVYEVKFRWNVLDEEKSRELKGS